MHLENGFNAYNSFEILMLNFIQMDLASRSSIVWLHPSHAVQMEKVNNVNYYLFLRCMCIRAMPLAQENVERLDMLPTCDS